MAEGREVQYLEVAVLLAAGRALLGVEPVVRDWGALDSAVHRPRAALFGEDAYPTLDHKAAALMLSVVQSRALVDGNTRLGLVAMVVFYGMNGVGLHAPHDEIFDLTMSIADGSVQDVATVADHLARWHE